MKISEIISPESVRLDLTSPSKTSLLQTISEIAATALGIAASEIFLALTNREKLGSTGIGQGIAIPHAPVPAVGSPFFLIVRLKQPIDFEAVDDAPVDIVCLLLTPVPGSQLNVLAHLARKLRSPEIVEAVRSASTPEGVYSLLADDGEP
ncbi:PTS sugar transporter subunit IIA [Sinorhizobium mexicanum]|uniref:PTS sugar transporter subunit IIA n=1 Tax=Sinorhizobium mexicanum TaxID=375549 RepID=A0A859QDM1_9HYPH|nr:PTS sugar transporter subunit IIA [Sinorhizobium mexicanum]MBP1885795.1 PTS system nitrogen regulatory IIA component [Sinorhizobium mexicanum]QLL60464.1 PTS sugar transporter subunit IIA [Sinorhizobium mexicanum]